MDMTIDLFRRSVGDGAGFAFRWREENEPYELPGVYCVDFEPKLDGVEKLAEERSVLPVAGDRRPPPDPPEEGWEAGGEDCGGVPRFPVVTDPSFSNTVSWDRGPE